MNPAHEQHKLCMKLLENVLRCNIIPQMPNEEYAFYLKKEGIRIKTVWYTSDSSCEFVLEEEGEYSIVGFIRIGDAMSILETSGVVYKKALQDIYYDFSGKTVNIFGSCVSRDLLEFEKKKNFFLKSYAARSSVLSVVSEAIVVQEEDINLASNFQKKQVFRDMSKGVWSEFRENASDYLIIDFIDERFPIGKYENSYFTVSNEFVESRFLKNQYCLVEREKIEDDYFVEGKELTFYLEEFLKRILDEYAENQIILHRAKHVNEYIGKDGRINSFSKAYLQYNQKMNEMLDYMYNYVEEKLPGCISLDFCDEYYADENHKWGLSTMHYIQDYYIRVLNELFSIIGK